MDIKISVEEYKSLLESKVLLQNAERVLQKKSKDYINTSEIADLLGIELESEIEHGEG